MVERSLHGRRILLVEDEYLLAEDLAHSLESAGAKVLGPAPSVDVAMELIASEPKIDLAVLDINLQGEMVFPVADALLQRGVPFAFATGYDEWSLPPRFASVARIEKPFPAQKLPTRLIPLLP